MLQHLTLAQGSAYVTTVLLSRAINSIGIVSTLSTLGVSWDELQWLMAALSVSLGFGLQAIFSDFVSGPITLFERPARTGDVVVINNLPGMVSRIHIRTTTITGLDRKKIIAPNQTFTTGQLVNWLLNDIVTRVTIKISLAYETDPPLTRKLMMRAIKENPRVLRDPELLLYFLTVGVSTFSYELHPHVHELGDCSPPTDEALAKIATNSREHKIDMALNQVDVFVKNLQGQQVQLFVGEPQHNGVGNPPMLKGQDDPAEPTR